MAVYDPDTVAAILEKALTLSSHARAAFLDHACHGDSDLHHELTSLLLSHDCGSDHFERVTARIIGATLLAVAANDQFSTGQTIAHYRLIERLGAGGMGVVFKARDLHLDRFVALKFLPPYLSGNEAAKERLIAEAKAASALDHPNIGVVHDIAETNEGCIFIVMVYYEGETLQGKLQRGGVSVPEAVDIVMQVASALSAAHEKGIIHRDVKPSNILVTKDGSVKLLDFGIAKFADSEPGHQGGIAGTVGYMSPEQLRGVDVDLRTDLWSLGVVLYELITGARPFRCNSNGALIRANGRDGFVAPRETMPEGMSRILQRCLAEDPASRHADARELLADFRALDVPGFPTAKPPARGGRRGRLLRHAIVAVSAGMIAFTAIYVEQRSDQIGSLRRTQVSQSHRSLAILPFVSTGSDADVSYLADAITGELIAQISRIASLRVIARSSITPYKGSRKTAPEIGRELAVTALLTGELRTTADHLQLTLRLRDAESQEELWSGDYTGATAQIQSVQRDIVLAVATALHVEGQSSYERSAVQAGTTSADAYLLYLKGRHVLEKRTVPAVKEAKAYFEEALDLDPAFAKAWAGLGESFSALSALAAIRTGDAYARSRAAAERALQIDPDLAEAHVCLATALSSYDWDFETATRHYQRALELSPSYADAHRLQAEHLRYQGRFDEALREARRAEELDPLSSAPQIVAGTILYWARQYDQAIAEYRRILETNPKFTYAYFFLALAFIQKHDYEEALQALTTPGAGSALQQDMLRGYIHAVTGRQGEARAALDRLQRLSREQDISPWHAAVIHLGLGEHDRAIDLLEQAYRAREWQLRMVAHEPLFDPLRSHPRFRVLVDRMRAGHHH